MPQQELLTQVVGVLNQLGIQFMLSGSHASSLQGEPRATHDIDLVADLRLTDAKSLLNAFHSDQFYLSESAVVEAIQSQRMFNLLDVTTGEKVDFWVLTGSPFDQSRFARRLRIQLENQAIDVSSPEDTILMKLHWSAASGGSEKQFQDVLRVYELQADILDRQYLQSWVARLGLEALWQRVVEEANPFHLPDDLLSK